MTTRFVWDELKDLVAIDDQINACKKEITQLRIEYAEQTAHLAPLKNRVESLHKKARELHKKIDSLSLNAADMQADFTRKDAQLSGLSHPKEYRALENELTLLERRINGAKKEIAQLKDEHDTTQLEHDEAAEKLAHDQKNVATIKDSAEQRLQHLKQQFATLTAAWNKQLALVPPGLKANYTQLRTRVENPVVPVVSSSCSACFESLLYQDTAALDTKSVIRCRNCYRFLFLPESPSVAAEQ